jgi:hypothetical protein
MNIFSLWIDALLLLTICVFPWLFLYDQNFFFAGSAVSVIGSVD